MASGVRDVGVTFVSRVLIIGLTIISQSALAWILGPGDRVRAVRVARRGQKNAKGRD
ncbi:MAG: hypothetical protein IMZ66_01660 [Planctomycetes bacterium]|nr:hypothetical protein [Planctomycetota bacterium]